MPVLPARLVWCCAALLCASATAAADLVAGPWLVLAPDGGLRVGCELSAPPAGPTSLVVGARRLAGGSRRLERFDGSPTWVADVLLPRGWAPGPYVLESDGHRLSGTLPALPAEDAPAHLAVMGGTNYPDPEGIAALGRALGAPPVIAIAAGANAIRALGRGGWEAGLPLVLLGGDGERLEAFAPGCVAPNGGVCGALAFAGVASRDAGAALLGGLSPWRVLIDTGATWDPGVLAPLARQEAGAAADVVALAAALRVPLVLACGGRAGFISEPLIARGGQVSVAGGGIRIVGATPAGEPLAGIAGTVAAGCDAAGLVGLVADAGELRLSVLQGDAPEYAITWRIDDPLGGGWGGGDGTSAWRAWVRGDAGALAGAAWAPGPTLAGITPSNDERARLLAAAAEDATARLCARRVLGQPGALPADTADLPDWLRRDLALRGLARGVMTPGTPAAGELVAGADPVIVHAALRRLDGRDRAMLLGLLIERLRAQGAGTLSLEAEPLLQHRLVAAVFDATDLSPTPLRPIAVALRPRLDPLARGPVERFIARHGELRR